MAESPAQSLLSHEGVRNFLGKSTIGGAGKQDIETKERELVGDLQDDHLLSFQWECTLFLRIILTTGISSALLVSDHRGWVLPLSASQYYTIMNNRASVQIAVQLLANIFALCQITALCTLINRATRLRFSRTEASMNDLQFWSHLCTRSMGWNLPFQYCAMLLMFTALTLMPSAFWAGALSPISVSTSHVLSVKAPSYTNATLIREYPSEFDSTTLGTQIRNSKGVFTYHIGITMEGALLSTASSATTVDGSLRRHVKLDDTGFTYIGRSYGVGAPAGLTDSGISNITLATSYTYQEAGYKTEVQCIYNASTNFLLYETYQGENLLVYGAIGQLPNSNGVNEESTYIGHSSASIVAIGVAARQTNGTQYMAVAAGSNYDFLNTTQCSIDYVPTLFNVTVNIDSKNITVLPIAASEDISPSGNLSHTTTRQLELISNDQTNLYQSLLGNSFMASIGDYNVSQSNSSVPLTQATATLAGLTNSVTAMLDDILVGYASAQLMVGNQSTGTEAVVTTTALKIGQSIYITAIFTLNLLIFLIVLEEAIRTMLWKGLGKWDYMDIAGVIVSSMKGGAKIDKNSGEQERKTMGKTMLRLDKRTDILMVQDTGKRFLD